MIRKLKLHHSKILADGSKPIMIYLSKKGVRVWITTGKKAKLHQWDEKSEKVIELPKSKIESYFQKIDKGVKVSEKEVPHPETMFADSTHINKILRSKMEVLEEVYKELEGTGGDFTPQRVKELYLKRIAKKGLTIYQFWKDEIKRREKEDGEVSTIDNYKLVLNSFFEMDRLNNRSGQKYKGFGYSKNAAFDDLTVNDVMEYRRFLEGGGKSLNTVKLYLTHLKSIFNLAIDKGFTSNYPFKKSTFDNLNYTPPKRILSLDEINLIKGYTTKEYNTENVRLNMFLFSLNAYGMNLADMAELKWSQIEDNTFTFIRSKTKRKGEERASVRVELPESGVKLLEFFKDVDTYGDYVFPIYSKQKTKRDKKEKLKAVNSAINKTLKKVRKEVGIEKNVTMYWARFTFATIVKQGESPIPIDMVQEMMGHEMPDITRGYQGKYEKGSYSKALEGKF